MTDTVVDQTTSIERAAVAPARLIALPLTVALTAIVLTFWTVDIVSPALPDIKDDLAVSSATVGLLYSVLFLGRLAGNFQPPRLSSVSAPQPRAFWVD